jgi:hypothetical protein
MTADELPCDGGNGPIEPTIVEDATAACAAEFVTLEVEGELPLERLFPSWFAPLVGLLAEGDEGADISSTQPLRVQTLVYNAC